MSRAHSQNIMKIDQNLLCFAHLRGELICETGLVGWCVSLRNDWSQICYNGGEDCCDIGENTL